LLIDLEFTSAWEEEKINHYLQLWNEILDRYFQKEIIMKVKVQFVSVRESDT
jgi:hypothetical protein